MAINPSDDSLGTVAEHGFSPSWGFKNQYVNKLNEDGLERFSQFSATPDSTILFAGPARFTGLTGPSDLYPIGMVDGIQFSSNPQLTRLYEIGSNRAFFTRGKTASSISFSRMLADTKNILAALSANSYKPFLHSYGMNSPGADTPNPDIMMNLDSEYFANPFGLMLIFRTRGGGKEDGIKAGKILTALYLEYCMFSSYNFGVSATGPAMAESIAIEFDRPIPVNFNS